MFKYPEEVPAFIYFAALIANSKEVTTMVCINKHPISSNIENCSVKRGGGDINVYGSFTWLLLR
jgi:hypothetical protein